MITSVVLIRLVNYFRLDAASPNARFVGFSIGLALAFNHLEYAMAIYDEIRKDENFPDFTDTLNEILLNVPITSIN